MFSLSRLFGKKADRRKDIAAHNARSIANLLAAAQQGVARLTEVSIQEQLVCQHCEHQFIAALGMQTGGRSTIVCPECKKIVFTR